MISRSSRWLMALTLMSSGLVVTPLLAVAPTIKDDAEFFKPEAIKRANEGIREIARKIHKDLLIETYSRPPAEQADKVKAMSREERMSYYGDWVKRRVDERVADGIVVIITREPGHVVVGITPGATSTFDHQFKLKIEQALISAFREKKYDDGLTNAVKLVCDKVGARFPEGGSVAPATPSSSSNDGFEPADKPADKNDKK
jgi:uncharacterized membrane protein YgcG